MSPQNDSPTEMLAAWRSGDVEAGNRLFSAAYSELHKIAAARLRCETPGHTLQPTALVSELYVRLFSTQAIEYKSRVHFMAVAAQNLRRILIEYARARRTQRRGGGGLTVTMVDNLGSEDQRLTADFLALDEALHSLGETEPRAARVVELRFFAGLTDNETAEMIGVSTKTVRRDWVYGRAWLLSRLRRE